MLADLRLPHWQHFILLVSLVSVSYDPAPLHLSVLKAATLYALQQMDPLPKAQAKARAAVDPNHARRVSSALARVQLDLSMAGFQLLLALNHYRRWLDTSFCDKDLHRLPYALSAYPCSASLIQRTSFLVARLPIALADYVNIPLNDLWVPVVTAIILAQIISLLCTRSSQAVLLWYDSFGRRLFMSSIGLVPKAVSLLCFFMLRQLPPSSYFSIYFPYEASITTWQQFVYSYPFWPGLAIVTAHCLMALVVVVFVPTRNPELLEHFKPAWTLIQTFAGASATLLLTLYQEGRLHCLWHHNLSGKTVYMATTTTTNSEIATSQAQVKDQADARGPVVASQLQHDADLDSFHTASITCVTEADSMDYASSWLGQQTRKRYPSYKSRLDATAGLSMQNKQFADKAEAPCLPAPNKQIAGQTEVLRLEESCSYESCDQCFLCLVTHGEDKTQQSSCACSQRCALPPCGKYSSQTRLQRVHIKVPFLHIENLPSNFMANVNSALTSKSGERLVVNACVRKGCIQLVVDVACLIDASAELDGLNTFLDSDMGQILDSLHLKPPPGSEVITQACGRVWVSTWQADTEQWYPRQLNITPEEVPKIQAVLPICILLPQSSPLPTIANTPGATQQELASSSPLAPSRAGARVPQAATSTAATAVAPAAAAVAPTVQAGEADSSGLPARSVLISVQVCNEELVTDFSVRCCGRYLPVEVVRRAEGHVTLKLSSLPRNGLLMLDCKMETLLSDSKPLIVTDCADISAEVAQLLQEGEDLQDITDLLVDLGCWLDFAATLRSPTPQSRPSASSFALGGDNHSAFSAPQSSMDTTVLGITNSTPAANGDHGLANGATGHANVANGLKRPANAENGNANHVQGYADGVIDYANGPDGQADGSLGHANTAAGALATSTTQSDMPSYGAQLAPCSADLQSDMLQLYQSATFRAFMSTKMSALLAFAVQHGWLYVSTALLRDLQAMGHDWSWILRSTQACPNAPSLSLLQRAISSGNPAMVSAVLAWGKAAGAPWKMPSLSSAQAPAQASDTDMPPEVSLAQRIMADYERTLRAVSQMSQGVQQGAVSQQAPTFGAPILSLDPVHDSVFGQQVNEAIAAAALRLSLSGQPRNRALVGSTMTQSALDKLAASREPAAKPPGQLAFGADLDLSRLFTGQVEKQLMLAGAVDTSAVRLAQLDQQLLAAGTSSLADGGYKQFAPPVTAGSTSTAALLARSDTAKQAPGNVQKGFEIQQQPIANVATGSSLLRSLLARTCVVWSSLPTGVWSWRYDAESQEYLRFVCMRLAMVTFIWELVFTGFVGALALRMFNGQQLYELAGAVPIFAAHGVSFILIIVSPQQYMRWREPLAAVACLGRVLYKALPWFGLAPYLSLTHYIRNGADVVSEGIMPALAEHVRPAYTFPLKFLEGIATWLLYRYLGVFRPWTALFWALAWNMACAIIVLINEARHRRAWLRAKANASLQKKHA